METIVRLIRGKSFSPEAIEAMSQAFVKAKAFLPEADVEAMNILTMRIITFASSGELDPDKLASGALAAFCSSRPAE